jgi:hypothetical protein
VEYHEQSIAADRMFCAVAGTAAALAMGQVSTAIYDRQSRMIHWRKNMAGGGVDLTPAQRGKPPVCSVRN